MITRRAAFEAGAVALGGIAVGGVVLGEHADPAVSAPSAKQDAEILNFALLLEYVQAAFYAEGLSRAGLTGELKTFASTVAAQEQEHIAFLKQALGSAARKAPKTDFGDDTSDADKFSLAAFKLEDLGVAAYNAQAPNLTKESLRAAARIVSVESRHAAWIRDLRGMNPAPHAAEPTVDAQRVIDTFKGSGYVQ
ncbi:ferritin-like domain-containing protein [Solirubrobacter soli]|uniref:ferritin-like domain-containing protein n=1 Tax=Solirubrobacter soli TaxID=363832 RepID=UPI0004074A32|nr:ferritin-like domain-containing protein [Solirubrobacter soli]